MLLVQLAACTLLVLSRGCLVNSNLCWQNQRQASIPFSWTAISTSASFPARRFLSFLNSIFGSPCPVFCFPFSSASRGYLE
ncbi:hypothetical protein HDV63DRAFT_379003 [Trichoderma sp. SZMC 28014]